MRKVKKKSYISIIVSTLMLILFSGVLLNEGIIYAGNVDTDGIENISAEQVNGDSITSNGIEEAPVNVKEQEKLYETVKDKINIQKEEAKEIFQEQIFCLFGDSITIADDEIWLMNVGGFENANYEWWLAVEDKENNKLYWCVQNAMTGSCSKVERYDYAGFNNANDAAVITRNEVELKSDQLESYIKKAEETIVKNNTFNSENSNVQFLLEDKFYIGNKPVVVLKTENVNGEIAQIAFYLDSDELMGIDIIKSINK